MSSDAGPDQDRKTHGAATVLLLAVAALLPARVLADVPPLPCSDGAQAFLLAAPGGGTASWDALAPDGSAVLGRVALTRGYWLRSEDFGVFHPLSAAEAALSPRAISNGARYVAGSRVIGGALVGVRRELATGSEMLLGALSPQDISGDGRSIAGTIQVGNAVCNVVTNNDFTYAAGLWVEGGGITALPFPGSGDGGLVATASGLLYPSVYGSIGGFAVQNVVTSAVVAGSGLAVAGTVSNGVWVDIHANVGGDVCLDGSFPQSCDPFTDPCPFGDRCEPWASATCATQAGGGSDAVRWVAGAPEIQRRPSIDIFSNIRLPMGGPADVGSVGVGQAAVTSISDYGRVVTGWSLAEASAAGGGTARTKFVTRWADGGPFEHLWEGNIGYASAEGDRVVGYGQFPPGHPLAGITAFMHWDPAHGTRELHGALRDDYGVSGFSFTSPAITASLHADGGIVLAPGRIGATYGLIAVVLPCPDRDQDNLCDSWEVAQGIDLNGDGALLPTDDLLLPGADPDHRDAYVEIDVLKGWNPPAGVLTAIQRAFADVPNSKIGNPDGRSGINLHLMQDEVGITLAGGGTVYQNVVAGCQLPPDFDTLRATHFGTPQERTSADVIATKHRLFRYVVYGGTQPSGHSGIAELPGNAAIVTLGGFTTLTGYGDDWIAGTLMHELGHTFGLRHGGSDNLKYKPNYHSIMNYTWQLRGRQALGSPLERLAFYNSWLLDYSRRAFDTLDESLLTEESGIGGVIGRVSVASPLSPCSTGSGSCNRLVFEQGGVDWDQNGIIERFSLLQPIDINDLRGSSSSVSGEILRSFDDWSALSGRLCSDYAQQNWDPAFDGTTSACGVGLQPEEELTAQEADAFLSQGLTFDCNLNGQDDQSEIVAGTANDLDGSGILDECEPIPGDLDGDDDVDLFDRDLLVASFGLKEGESGYQALADFDSDRLISFVDYQRWVQLYDAWTTGTTSTAAVQPACGLLGFELLPVVALARRLRRKSRRRALRRGERR